MIWAPKIQFILQALVLESESLQLFFDHCYRVVGFSVIPVTFFMTVLVEIKTTLFSLGFAEISFQ